jgi:hypothetical protein
MLPEPSLQRDEGSLTAISTETRGSLGGNMDVRLLDLDDGAALRWSGAADLYSTLIGTPIGTCFNPFPR